MRSIYQRESFLFQSYPEIELPTLSVHYKPLKNPTPPDADSPGCKPSMKADSRCRPPAGHVNCDACLEAKPNLDRMTDSCKNVTLPVKM